MRALCVPHVLAGLRPAQVLGNTAHIATESSFVAANSSIYCL